MRKNLGDRKDIMEKAVLSNALALQFASERVKNDSNLILAALSSKNAHNILKFIPEYFLTNKSLMIAGLKVLPDLHTLLKPELLNDREFVQEYLGFVDPHIFFRSQNTAHYKNDKDLILSALKTNPSVLRCVSETLRQDKDFLLNAVIQNKKCINEMNGKLFEDLDLLKNLVNYDPEFVRMVPKSACDNRELMLFLVSKNWQAIRYCSSSLKNDWDIAYAAVSQNGLALQFCSTELRKDPEITITAVHQNIGSLHLVDPIFKNDFDFARNVILGVEYDGNWFDEETILRARLSTQKSARK